jgi:hypothetical protein
MKAGAREVTVDCSNQFKRAEQPVTYYVGPLDGLFCMGLADEGRWSSSGSDGHLPHDRP